MLMKPCARCGRMMPYGKTHCDNCAPVAEQQKAERLRASRQRYDSGRDPRMVAFYHSKAWKALSRRTLQAAGYLCQYCGEQIATEVDHVVSLEEDFERRFDPDNLKAACHRCHDRKHGRFTPGGG